MGAITASPGADRGSTLRKAAERGVRRSGFRAALFLAVAAIAAVGTAVLFTRYLDVKAAAARIPTVKIVVAAVDVPATTALRPESLTLIDWPAASVPEGAGTSPAALAGRVVISALSKGEPILASRLAAPGAGAGLAAILPAGMRAVAVRVDDVVGVAGFVHPGDKVDVIVTMKPVEGSNSPPMSKIVLQAVQVLAVGKEVQRAERNLEKAIPATVATLMVDSEDSERLALAASKGQLLLSLRSAADDDSVSTRGMTPPVLLAMARDPDHDSQAAPSTGPKAAPSRRHAPRPAAVEPPRPVPAEKQTVEILRGDTFERRDFDKEKGTHP